MHTYTQRWNRKKQFLYDVYCIPTNNVKAPFICKFNYIIHLVIVKAEKAYQCIRGLI